MIDFYLHDKSLQTKDKIIECYEYYLKKDLTYDEIYEEYDKIMNLNPKLEFTPKNIFFKKDKLLRIKTNFMKECLLESLKMVIEEKSEKDSKDLESDLNGDIEYYKEDFNYYPDNYEINLGRKKRSKKINEFH